MVKLDKIYEVTWDGLWACSDTNNQWQVCVISYQFFCQPISWDTIGL